MGKRGSIRLAGQARLVVVVAAVLAVCAMDACGGELAGEAIEFNVGGTAVAPPTTGAAQAGGTGVGGFLGRAGFAGTLPAGGWVTMIGGWTAAGRAGSAGMGPTSCTPGYPCSTPYSTCVSGGVTCICVGGAWGACSLNGTGGTGATGPTGLPTPNGIYASGGYAGPVWGVADTAGSTITLTDNYLCASGTAVRVPYNDAGQPDWAGAWGVALGWNLNEPYLLDGGVPGLANLAGKTSITVGLVGATGLNMRVQLTARDWDAGAPVYYCASLPATGATIPLSSLTTQCWAPGGAVFDPATVYPENLAITVVTDQSLAYPFKFCVTALGIW
jgi:hypothetical protein